MLLKHTEWQGWKKSSSNGTSVTTQPFETTFETTQPINTVEAVTSTTTVYNKNNNNKVKWVHNLSKTP